MRILPHALITALTLGVLAAAPALAGVREASLGVEGDTALALLRFDGQPPGARIHKIDGGVEIIAAGVNGAAARIVPADAHLLSAIDVKPGADGLHLLFHFRQQPVQSTIEVYDHALLLRARFDHPLRAQKSMLDFAHASPQKVPVQHIAKADTAAETSARPVAGGHSESDPMARTGGRDGAPATDTSARHAPAQARPHEPPPELPHEPRHGASRVREASAPVAVQKLDAKTCAAAKKVIEDDPWALDKMSLYGDCIAKEGKTEAAKEVFARLLTFDPEMISAYVGLGKIARKKGDTKAARIYYQKAAALGGNDAQASQVHALLAALDEGE